MCGTPDAAVSAASNLGIDLTGTPILNSTPGSIVRRVLRRASRSLDAGYVLATDEIDGITSADIVTLASFESTKRLLRAKVRKGLGIELLVDPVRTRSAEGVARWLEDLKGAYRFCSSTGCQFILSSGAVVPSEMVSGRCIDELLTEVNIEPKKYWQDLEKWLGQVTSRRVIVP